MDMIVRRGAVLASALLAATLTAQAQTPGGGPESGLSVAVGGGESDFEIDCRLATACDSHGKVARATLGWHRGNLGVELIALRFGQVDLTLVLPPFGDVPTELESEMFGIGGVLLMPLSERFEASLRVGAANVRSRLRGVALGVAVETQNRSHAALYGGVGLSFKITRWANVQLNWESTQASVDAYRGAVRAMTLSIGARF